MRRSIKFALRRCASFLENAAYCQADEGLPPPLAHSLALYGHIFCQSEGRREGGGGGGGVGGGDGPLSPLGAGGETVRIKASCLSFATCGGGFVSGLEGGEMERRITGGRRPRRRSMAVGVEDFRATSLPQAATGGSAMAVKKEEADCE